MLIEIDSHSGVPIYRQVEDQVRRQILAGQLPDDSQVMSVRELAAQVKVNPLTVSKAYATLEREGLLERRRGVGLFVKIPSAQRLQARRVALIGELVERIVREALQLEVSEGELVEAVRATFVKLRKG